MHTEINTTLYKGVSSITPNTEFVIKLNMDRDELVGLAGTAMLKDRYFAKGEASPQHLFARVSCALSDSQEMAQKVYDYMSSMWFMPATPILTNAGTERGLTISCYLNAVTDSITGLTDNFTENAFLSVNGGGIGSDWSRVRSIGTPTSRGSYTSGAVAFMKQTDALVESYWQGGCYTPDHEILTADGWKTFLDLSDEDLVAQVDDNREVTFVKPIERTIRPYTEDLVHISGPNTDLLVTKNHNMVVEPLRENADGLKRPCGELLFKPADAVKYHRDVVHHASAKSTGSLEWTAQDAFLIALQADGHVHKNGFVEFHFSKERKINRLRSLLNELGWSFTEVKVETTGNTKFYLPSVRNPTKVFSDWVKISEIGVEWGRSFLLELAEWDGSWLNDSTFTYSTVDESNAKVVQAIAALTDVRLKYRKESRELPRKDLIVLTVQTGVYTPVSGETIKKAYVPYSGFVYCCVVPHGRLLVRRNGIVSVCGNTRRGAAAVYLSVSHPEIEEFIEIRKPTGGDVNRKCLNIHHAVSIPDSFMQAVTKGALWDLVDPHTNKTVRSVKARDLWMKILETRMVTGEPYLFFSDTVNKAVHPNLKKQGYSVGCSNLCVAPETPVLTVKGYKPIIELAGKTEKVWNGVEWSEATFAQTGVGKNLIRVTFSDGSSLDCTPEHIFYIQTRYGGESFQKKAKDLCAGDKLEKMELPVTFEYGTKVYPNAYEQGFYAGDGNEGYSFSWIYGPKLEVIPRLRLGKVQSELDQYNRLRWDHGLMPNDKFHVPFDGTKESRIEWLSGLLDADGCVIESDNAQCIQIVSAQSGFLHNVKLFLQEMGVQSSLTLRRKSGLYDLPKNDGTGELGSYDCRELWGLQINTSGTKRLLDLGLNCSRLKFKPSSTQNPQRDASRFVKVVSVEKTGRVSDTYCFNEPLRHKGVFNGVLTGNCSEIMLKTDEDYTAVCCLSSVNVEYFDEWSKDSEFIYWIMRFLDNNVTLFTKLAPKEMWRAVKSAELERSVGLGQMGHHLYLQNKGIPWETPMAIGQTLKIAKHIKENVDRASLELGKERGPAPMMLDTGDRFAHKIAIAPNASIAPICGSTSPSIEPYISNVYSQKGMSGSFFVKNKALDRVLTEHYGLTGQDKEKVWSSVTVHKGSVQHLEFMTKEHKELFKTSRELDQLWVIEHAAARQPFVCQGQSVNIFVPAEIDRQVLHNIHRTAWQKGLKSLYYCRSQSVGTLSKLFDHSLEGLEQIKQLNQKNKSDTIDANVTSEQIAENEYASACLSCQG